MQGAGANHTQYLQTLHYDKFEQRTYMKLGNGIETRYTYRPDNRRLKNLNSEGKTAGKFQNLDYSYDRVGNITDLANSVDLPKPGAFGGPTAQTFGYDDLYRLTSATGRFTSSPSKVRDYTLDMGYDDIHNITAKTQTDTITTPDGSRIPQKATSYDWAYAYGAQQPHAPSHIGSHSYSYDLNGNQLGWEDDKSGARRIILWDEDNRISEILDNGHSSKYTYDDQGQRVIKETKQGEAVYVNQYYVVRNRSIVSKHLFAGSSRLVTRLEMGTAKGNGNQGSGSNPTSLASTDGSGLTSHGNSGQQHGNQGNQGNAYGQDKQQDNPGQGNAQGQGNTAAGNGNGKAQGKGNSGSHGPSTGSGQAGSTNLPGNSEKGLENALANGQGNKYGIYKHLAKEGYTVDEGGNIVVDAGDAGDGGAAPITGEVPPAQVNGQSEFTYYYHPDHLGSTGFVTDASGKLYEHIEYFPFGETWVQEHSNTLRTPYLFTGKEYDQETGLYYFGARYYDPRTSVWASPDPILNMYMPDSAAMRDLPGMGGAFNSKNLGLYTYAHHNPIIYHDPDGNFVKLFVTIAKVAIKGGDIYSTVSGIVDNAKIIGDPNASIGDKLAAAADIALDVGTGINTKDIKVAVNAVDKVKDKVASMKHTCSFAPDTLVMTKEGLKPIDTLKAGDMVLARDEITGEQTWKKVLVAYSSLHDDALTVTFVDAKSGKTVESVITTAEHPFYVKDHGWTPAGELKAGDLTLTASGGWIKVGGATWMQRNQLAYNMEVEDFHTYFVGNSEVWVHNACELPPVKATKMQQKVERDQASRNIERFDSAEKDVPKSQDHVHFKDGKSMNADGTVHDQKQGPPKLTNADKKFLEKHNWPTQVKGEAKGE